jgi:hypothetical protein
VLERHCTVLKHCSRREVTKGAMGRTAVRAERALADGGPWLDSRSAPGADSSHKKMTLILRGVDSSRRWTRGGYYVHLSHPINNMATASGQE